MAQIVYVGTNAVIAGTKITAGKPNIGCYVEVYNPTTKQSVGACTTDKLGKWSINVPIVRLSTGQHHIMFIGSGTVQALPPDGDWELLDIPILDLSTEIEIVRQYKTDAEIAAGDAATDAITVAADKATVAADKETVAADKSGAVVARIAAEAAADSAAADAEIAVSGAIAVAMADAIATASAVNIQTYNVSTPISAGVPITIPNGATYKAGSNNLLVFVNGILQVKGSGIDYFEIGNTGDISSTMKFNYDLPIGAAVVFYIVNAP